MPKKFKIFSLEIFKGAGIYEKPKPFQIKVLKMKKILIFRLNFG